MQYLISVIDDGTGTADSTEMAAIDAFNERLQAEGHWVFAGGLASPSTATVIDSRGGSAVFTDGPFLETKEHIAGLWVVEAPDLDVAPSSPPTGRRPATGRWRCGRSRDRDPIGSANRWTETPVDSDTGGQRHR